MDSPCRAIVEGQAFALREFIAKGDVVMADNM